MKAFEELSDAEFVGLCVDSALQRIDQSNDAINLMTMMYMMLDAKLAEAEAEVEAVGETLH